MSCGVLSWRKVTGLQLYSWRNQISESTTSVQDVQDVPLARRRGGQRRPLSERRGVYCCNQELSPGVQTDAGCARTPWWRAVLLLSHQTLYTRHTHSLWAWKRKRVNLLLFSSSSPPSLSLLKFVKILTHNYIIRTDQTDKKTTDDWLLRRVLWCWLLIRTASCFKKSEQPLGWSLGSKVNRSVAKLTGCHSDIINYRRASGRVLRCCTHARTNTKWKYCIPHICETQHFKATFYIQSLPE